MSAERDRSQKVGFVYSNIYELYKNSQALAKAEKEAAKEAEKTGKPRSLSLKTNSRVLRVEELGDIKVTKFEPQEFKREVPEAVKMLLKQNEALGEAAKIRLNIQTLKAQDKSSKSVEELQENIHKLESLHSRLRFMLKELEDLVGAKKKS